MDEESSEELEQEKEMNEEYDDSNLPESPFIHTKKKVKAIGNEVPPPFETFEELHKKLQTNLTFDPFSNQTSNNKKKPKKKTIEISSKPTSSTISNLSASNPLHQYRNTQYRYF